MATAKPTTLEETPGAETEGRSLIVQPSDVRYGGSVRIHESVRSELALPANALVEVCHGKKTLALRLYADDRVGPNEIRLREPDMRRLGVAAGETVQIRPYIPAAVIVRENVREFGAGIARRLHRPKKIADGEE